MKKTYNINISGNVFTIDDDAYTLLNDYLETLDHVFHDSGNDEIIPDIENRISEIFSLLVAEGKSVITLQDVESVIARIGKPEELVEVSVNESVKDTEDGKEQIVDDIDVDEQIVPPPYTGPVTDGTKTKKKLFRDSKEGMLGGVCAGLSHYLDFDVTWIRLIAVGIVFLSFFSFISVVALPIVYIVLWIVLPNATTPLQRMQMKGDVPTLSNIGKSVTGNFRQSQENNTPFVDDPQKQNGDKRIADNVATFFGVLGKICLWILVIIAVPVEIALAIGFIGCIFALLLMGTSHGSDIFGIPPISAIDYQEVVLGLTAAIGYIILLGIPLYLFIMLVLAPNRKPWSRVVKISVLIIWIIGFVMAAVTTGLLVSYNEMKEEFREREYIESRSMTDGENGEEEMNGIVFIDEEGQSDSINVEESQAIAESIDSVSAKDSSSAKDPNVKTNVKVKTK